MGLYLSLNMLYNKLIISVFFSERGAANVLYLHKHGSSWNKRI